MKPNDMILSKEHKKLLLRGRTVTRKELIENGKKVAEHSPDYGKSMPITYIEYQSEIFLLDKGYIRFIAHSFVEFKNLNLMGVELKQKNWVWNRPIIDNFS